MNGYDFENIGTIPSIAKIPILLSGGCSGVECIQEAYERGFDGAMMSSIFLWQGDSIPSLKDALFEKVPVRRVVQ
jgi:imidazole glycerol phosphate synthase subunit HisF